MANIATISVTPEDKAYMENENLSPTAVLRQALMKRREESERKDLDLSDEKIEKLANKYSQALRFMEEKGVLHDFWIWKNKKGDE